VGCPCRDVKPLNIIASGRDGRLKLLIDLGAAADLRTGTNYSPDESILDPMYCPPEQVTPWQYKSPPAAARYACIVVGQQRA